ncbi:phosphatase PAP2 family protein [Pedobacter aquatilis]|uniref:phosphatase PAP2 family protein n=1 Tax=Pedobacter aquatilis TaxID=351343 RepID=UPI0029304489|nr:phosphatase PAP2 family protein [Pedobacter aquatilis]
MRKNLLLTFTCFIFPLICVCQQIPSDSTVFSENNGGHPNSFLKASIAPAVLFSASALSWGKREEIRKLRNRYLPDFRNHFDDYLQYVPAISVCGLNAAGVKGRHSIQRTTVSYLFSAATMAIVVNTLKHSAGVERPDGSAFNSFPSGHTANSFMNAAFLNKEYGQAHPLLGIGAYTMAGATAVGRQMNNRHWVSDVLAGAGIGLLATEAGYLIADKIYKDKGIKESFATTYMPRSGKPSFIGINIGVARAVTQDLNNPNGTINAEHGFGMELSGAWFFKKNFGLGGKFAFSSFPIRNDNYRYSDPDIPKISEDIYTQPTGVRYLHFGPYFSFPLKKGFFLNANFLVGKSIGADGNIILALKEEYQPIFQAVELPYFKYKPNPATSWSTSFAVQKLLSRNLALKAYVNYFDSKHLFKVDYLSSIDPNGKYIYSFKNEVSIRYNHIVYGIGIAALLWK